MRFFLVQILVLLCVELHDATNVVLEKKNGPKIVLTEPSDEKIYLIAHCKALFKFKISGWEKFYDHPNEQLHCSIEPIKNDDFKFDENYFTKDVYVKLLKGVDDYEVSLYTPYLGKLKSSDDFCFRIRYSESFGQVLFEKNIYLDDGVKSENSDPEGLEDSFDVDSEEIKDEENGGTLRRRSEHYDLSLIKSTTDKESNEE